MNNKLLIIAILIFCSTGYSLDSFKLRIGYGGAAFFHETENPTLNFPERYVILLDQINAGVLLSPIPKLDIGIEYEMSAFFKAADKPSMRIYKTDLTVSWLFTDWHNKPFIGIGFSGLYYNYNDIVGFKVGPTIFTGFNIYFKKGFSANLIVKDLIRKFDFDVGHNVNNIFTFSLNIQKSFSIDK